MTERVREGVVEWVGEREREGGRSGGGEEQLRREGAVEEGSEWVKEGRSR